MASPIQVRPWNDDWKLVWASDKGDRIGFFSYLKTDDSEFRVVGDTVIVGEWTMTDGRDQIATYAPDPSCPWSLAHPVEFNRILDDAGSGNRFDITYWWPVAPADYIPLGLCFTNGEKPDPNCYWCVHKNFCIPTGQEEWWSDRHQSWKHHDGNLVRPTADMRYPDAIVPTTFLSVEAMRNGMGVPMMISNK